MNDNNNNNPPALTPERRDEIRRECGSHGVSDSTYPFYADPTRIDTYVDSKVREERERVLRNIRAGVDDFEKDIRAQGAHTLPNVWDAFTLGLDFVRALTNSFIKIRKDPNDGKE